MPQPWHATRLRILRFGPENFLRVVLITSLISSSGGQSPGNVIAESDFRVDGTDSWSVKGGGAGQLQVFTVQGSSSQSRGFRLAAQGHGREWFFIAPPKFLGDKLEAYQGVLEFRLGHVHHMGDELDRKKTWGVHIVGTSVTISALASVGLNSIKLAEGDGWTVTKGVGSGHAPTQLQMLGILADVSELKIRGNFFRSSEMTHISYVRLLAGTQDVGKLRDRVQKSPLAKAKTPTPQLVGVGILLAPQINNSTQSISYYVKALQSGSPAHLCHRIHEGDRLLSVDGHFVDGKRLRQIARLIVGEVGSKVELRFEDARQQPYAQKLERQPISPDTPFSLPKANPMRIPVQDLANDCAETESQGPDEGRSMGDETFLPETDPSDGFTPAAINGNLIVSGSWDDTVKIWDASIGEPQSTLSDRDFKEGAQPDADMPAEFGEDIEREQETNAGVGETVQARGFDEGSAKIESQGPDEGRSIDDDKISQEKSDRDFKDGAEPYAEMPAEATEREQEANANKGQERGTVREKVSTASQIVHNSKAPKRSFLSKFRIGRLGSDRLKTENREAVREF